MSKMTEEEFLEVARAAYRGEEVEIQYGKDETWFEESFFDKSSIYRIKPRKKPDHGVYKIYWRDGGSFVGVIGSLHNGDRWIACANWTAKDGNTPSGKFDWENISKLERLDDD